VRAEAGGGHGAAVAVDRAQPRRVGQHGGPVGQGRLRPAGRRRGWDQRRERLGRRMGRQHERDEHRGGSRGGQCGDRERAATGDTGGHGSSTGLAARAGSAPMR